jgi:DNA-binding XRE family transcriptional regulator
MEQENHIGDRIGVKDADRALATDASSSLGALGNGRSPASAAGGPPTLSTRPTITSSEGGDGGGAAASLHDAAALDNGGLHGESSQSTPAAPPPVVRVTAPQAPHPSPAPITGLASLSDEDDDDDDAPAQREGVSKKKGTKASTGRGPHTNNVRKLRIERMMSKAELARRANLSVLTIDRVEKGFGCRMDSKRKILEALGLSLADRVRVFGEEE